MPSAISGASGDGWLRIEIGPPFPDNSVCQWSPYNKHRESGPHMIVDRPYCVYCGAKDVEFTFSKADDDAEREWLKREFYERAGTPPPWRR